MSKKSRSEKQAKGQGDLAMPVPKTIRFMPSIVAMVEDRIEAEKVSLREIHAHNFNGVINELAKRWGRKEINL